MKVAFWVAVALVFYAYLGYALWLWIYSWLSPQPVRRGIYQPMVSVVMVVRDEENTLPRKLRNLAALEYREDRLEFVVVSDGSRDGTEKILFDAAANDTRCHVASFSDAKGKACRLNDALAMARGEIVLFVDARQQIERDALRLLMENFVEDEVGCASSGELMLGDAESGEAEKGMGMYWRMEKKIREMESASGSVVGATGAIYAARALRCWCLPLPADTILDDVFLPLHVAKQGARVVFDVAGAGLGQPRSRLWTRVSAKRFAR